jgi:hypothetical protein
MGRDTISTRPGKASFWTASAAAVAAGLLRLVPMPPNLVPVGALGLFGGARLRSWHAFALPLAVMAVTDLLLWQLRGWQPFDPFVYASFLLYVVIGRALCRTSSVWRIGTASVLGSVQFYLITNFGAWLQLSNPSVAYYPRSAAGLLQAYLAGLPFAGQDAPAPLGWFGNTLLADLGFTFLLLGAYAGVLKVLRTRRHAAPVAPEASSAA